MPGLYIPLRTSSSSASASKPAGAPLAAAPAASSCRHLQAVPPIPVPPRPLLPSFHTAAKRAMGTETAQPVWAPKEGTIPEDCRTHRNSSLNYCSSGSLHLHDPSSMCLAAMVHDFLEEEEEDEEEQEQQKVSLNGAASGCGRARCNCVDGVCGTEACEDLEDDKASDQQVEQLCEILEGYTSCVNGLLLKEVGKAIEELTAPTQSSGAEKVNGIDVLRRAVMTRLRTAGYNAAACKSRWNRGDGLSAGDYEYIDVIMNGKDGKEVRLIVDINFKAQFEIARPSSEYARMLKVVPTLYVGRAERINAIVKMMSHAAKRSLRAQGLMMPPWRRHKYMQAKWLSPIYRRTTNMEPTRLSSQTSVTEEDDINMLISASTGAQGGFRFGAASNYLAATAKINQRGIKRPEESWALIKRGMNNINGHYKRPALNVGEENRGTMSVMCTSWQLPSLMEKPSIKAPLVSALSSALQEQVRSK